MHMVDRRVVLCASGHLRAYTRRPGIWSHSRLTNSLHGSWYAPQHTAEQHGACSTHCSQSQGRTARCSCFTPPPLFSSPSLAVTMASYTPMTNNGTGFNSTGASTPANFGTVTIILAPAVLLMLQSMHFLAYMLKSAALANAIYQLSAIFVSAIFNATTNKLTTISTVYLRNAIAVASLTLVELSLFVSESNPNSHNMAYALLAADAVRIFFTASVITYSIDKASRVLAALSLVAAVFISGFNFYRRSRIATAKLKYEYWQPGDSGELDPCLHESRLAQYVVDGEKFSVHNIAHLAQIYGFCDVHKGPRDAVESLLMDSIMMNAFGGGWSNCFGFGVLFQVWWLAGNRGLPRSQDWGTFKQDSATHAHFTGIEGVFEEMNNAKNYKDTGEQLLALVLSLFDRMKRHKRATHNAFMLACVIVAKASAAVFGLFLLSSSHPGNAVERVLRAVYTASVCLQIIAELLRVGRDTCWVHRKGKPVHTWRSRLKRAAMCAYRSDGLRFGVNHQPPSDVTLQRVLADLVTVRAQTNRLQWPRKNDVGQYTTFRDTHAARSVQPHDLPPHVWLFESILRHVNAINVKSIDQEFAKAFGANGLVHYELMNGLWYALELAANQAQDPDELAGPAVRLRELQSLISDFCVYATTVLGPRFIKQHTLLLGELSCGNNNLPDPLSGQSTEPDEVALCKDPGWVFRFWKAVARFVGWLQSGVVNMGAIGHGQQPPALDPIAGQGRTAAAVVDVESGRATSAAYDVVSQLGAWVATHLKKAELNARYSGMTSMSWSFWLRWNFYTALADPGQSTLAETKYLVNSARFCGRELHQVWTQQASSPGPSSHACGLNEWVNALTLFFAWLLVSHGQGNKSDVWFNTLDLAGTNFEVLLFAMLVVGRATDGVGENKLINDMWLDLDLYHKASSGK